MELVLCLGVASALELGTEFLKKEVFLPGSWLGTSRVRDRLGPSTKISLEVWFSLRTSPGCEVLLCEAPDWKRPLSLPQPVSRDESRVTDSSGSRQVAQLSSFLSRKENKLLKTWNPKVVDSLLLTGIVRPIVCGEVRVSYPGCVDWL